jgi:hypothetical protein
LPRLIAGGGVPPLPYILLPASFPQRNGTWGRYVYLGVLGNIKWVYCRRIPKYPNKYFIFIVVARFTKYC